MTKKNLTLRRTLSLLLALVLLAGLLPSVSLPARADWRDDWEWGDNADSASATCPDCGFEYVVYDVESSADAEAALEEYFCPDCGLCSYQGKDD